MKYTGICHKCFKMVKKGEGTYKRLKGNWRTEHTVCEVDSK